MSSTTHQAEVGALLESHFRQLSTKGAPYNISGIPGLEGYTVIETGTFDRGPDLGGDCFKAITVRDPQGNIYVHFNGTGDGNWVLNAAAYDKQASAIQEWAREYCDHTILENYILNPDQRSNNPNASIYLTGHSQGGNNAQYAMLTTKYADYIDACISLDGPGFSHDVVKTIKDSCGPGEYEERVNKIYAYNGSHDFVSPLGQEQVVRDDHSYFVLITDGYNREGKDDGMASYHMVEYMLDEDGHLGEVRPANSPDNGESDFRKMVRDLNEQVNRLPPGQQRDAAIKTMKLIEYLMGGNGENIKGDLSLQELCQLLEVLIPVIIATAIENPGDLIRVLNELGLLDPLKDLLVNHPILAAVLVNCFPGFIAVLAILGVSVVNLLVLIDVIATAIDKIISAYQTIRDFCIKAFDIIKKGVKAIAKWARNTFNRGVKYVKNHPSFSADPSKLREYASRLNNVNKRLRSLDRKLDGLYWQVGFSDLKTILDANLLTSGSPTFTQIQWYLNNTANRLEKADRKAAENMGG